MKLLISGYYGFGNLGDEALLAGLVSRLEARGHHVTVLSGAPAKTRALHGVAAKHRYRSVLPALAACDVLISGGGGLLQDKTSSRSLVYYLALLRIAKRLRKGAVVYAQSVGPLSDKGRAQLRYALKNVPVAVRDEASQKLLASLNIESQLTADSALLLEPPAETGADPSHPVLLVPRYGYPDITDGLVRVGRALRSKGIAVAAVSAQANEDEGELERLRTNIPELKVMTASTPTDLLAIISHSDYVVSARLHGLILAAVAGVDFCGVVYDPKVAAFLSEAGAPSFALPLNPQALLRCALDRPEVPRENLAGLTQRALEGLDWLEEQFS